MAKICIYCNATEKKGKTKQYGSKRSYLFSMIDIVSRQLQSYKPFQA